MGGMRGMAGVCKIANGGTAEEKEIGNKSIREEIRGRGEKEKDQNQMERKNKIEEDKKREIREQEKRH